MDYDFKINGRETSVYKCYSDGSTWIATIRHYDDAEAIEKLLKQYGDKILTITKADKIIWDIRQNFNIKNTAGIVGINACGDGAIAPSEKQEAPSPLGKG